MLANNSYKDEIASCLLELDKNGQSVTWDNFLTQMQNIIVESYREQKNITDFKGDWKSDFILLAKELNITVQSSKDNWSLIEERIDSLKTVNNDVLEDIQSVTTGNDASISKSSSRQSSTDKNYFLTTEDKENCKRMYESLNTSKMWTLTTGKVVEKQMESFALSCVYEHPAHSLILDLSDTIWTDYFTADEILEIMSKNRTALPPLPEDLRKYVSSFDKEFSDPLVLYYQTKDTIPHPYEEKDKKWGPGNMCISS